MVKNVLFFCFWLLGVIAYAQPRFVADAEIRKTGEVLFQKPHTIVFGFTNKGDKPLHIKRAEASCGCAKVTYTRGNIVPGARGEVVVVYDAALLGAFSKYVEVYTNASKDPEFLQFQGRVVTELSDYTLGFPIDLGNVRMNTNYVEFDNVKKGDVVAAELQIANADRTAYRPELMHLPTYMYAECVPEVIPGGKTGVVRIILDTKKMQNYGLTQNSVYLARYSGDKIGADNEIVVSSVIIPAKEDASAESQLSLSSEELLFSKSDKKMKATVMLTNNGSTPLQIHAIQVFNHAVEAELSNTMLAPGKTAKMKITVRKDFLDRFKARPRVLVISDDKREPVKRINIIVKDN
jgi:hypothetical protein